ncbi:MAG: HAD hydrolase-like protein [Deltaproteobacteria bacterium]|nr:HAD hydrolase-like protein [Deltaproteobacteria bacterium]
MSSSLYLFDIDGTLLSADDLHGRCLVKAAAQMFNVRPNPDKLNYAGMTDRQILTALLEECGVVKGRIAARIQECIEVSHSLFSRSAHQAELVVLPGVQALLTDLKAKSASIGLVTGNIEIIARKKLEIAGLGDFFEHGGFGCESHSHRYELVLSAVRKFQETRAAPEKIFVIGDTVRDIEAAREAKAISVAVATGRAGIEELAAHNPDVLLRDLSNTEEFYLSIDNH